MKTGTQRSLFALLMVATTFGLALPGPDFDTNAAWSTAVLSYTTAPYLSNSLGVQNAEAAIAAAATTWSTQTAITI